MRHTMNRREASKIDQTVYVDWDEDLQAFGVFGDESGFCYFTDFSRDVADDYASDWNNRKGEALEQVARTG